MQDIYKFTEEEDDRRIMAGTVYTGKIKAGEEVIFLPSGKRTRIKSIEEFNAPAKQEAAAGEAGAGEGAAGVATGAAAAAGAAGVARSPSIGGAAAACAGLCASQASAASASRAERVRLRNCFIIIVLGPL